MIASPLGIRFIGNGITTGKKSIINKINHLKYRVFRIFSFRFNKKGPFKQVFKNINSNLASQNDTQSWFS
jgi:hypothetical protein